MNLTIKNLGNIREGNLNLKDLNIFTGKSNTGKTYVSYTLFELLNSPAQFNSKEIDDIVNNLYTTKNFIKLDLINFADRNYLKIKKQIENNFSKRFYKFFNSIEEDFKHSKIEINKSLDEVKKDILNQELKEGIRKPNSNIYELSITKKDKEIDLRISFIERNHDKECITDLIKDAIYQIMFPEFSQRPFFIPAERTGLNLFFRELNVIRSNDSFNRETHSKYPTAIGQYMQFLNKAYDFNKEESEFSKLANSYIGRRIIGGKYLVTEHEIYFLPKQLAKTRKNSKSRVELNLASSTAKTMFGLYFYLSHIAKKGDVLFIDHIELDLNQKHQTLLIDLLVVLANKGIKIVASTKSKFVINEIKTSIVLDDFFESTKAVARLHGFNPDEVISEKNIKTFNFIHSTIQKNKLD